MNNEQSAQHTVRECLQCKKPLSETNEPFCSVECENKYRETDEDDIYDAVRKRRESASGSQVSAPTEWDKTFASIDIDLQEMRNVARKGEFTFSEYVIRMISQIRKNLQLLQPPLEVSAEVKEEKGEGWVSVDTPPEKNKKVLVVNKYGRMRTADWEPYTNMDLEWFKEEFTHWRELPAPPHNSK